MALYQKNGNWCWKQWRGRKRQEEKMRRKIFLFTILILLTFNFFPLLHLKAEEQDKAKPTRQMTGKVSALSKEKITIINETAEPDTADALPHSFHIDDNTVIKGEVSEGKTVTITYYIKWAYKDYIKRLALTIEVLENK